MHIGKNCVLLRYHPHSSTTVAVHASVPSQFYHTIVRMAQTQSILAVPLDRRIIKGLRISVPLASLFEAQPSMAFTVPLNFSTSPLHMGWYGVFVIWRTSSNRATSPIHSDRNRLPMLLRISSGMLRRLYPEPPPPPPPRSLTLQIFFAVRPRSIAWHSRRT